MSAPSHMDDRFCAVEVLSPSGDVREAARNLFAVLRRLDAMGLGLAIMDRLRRCAASNQLKASELSRR